MVRSPFTPMVSKELESVRSFSGFETLIYWLLGWFWLGPCRCVEETFGARTESPDAYMTPSSDAGAVLDVAADEADREDVEFVVAADRGSRLEAVLVDVLDLDVEAMVEVELVVDARVLVTRMAPSMPTVAKVG